MNTPFEASEKLAAALRKLLDTAPDNGDTSLAALDFARARDEGNAALAEYDAAGFGTTITAISAFTSGDIIAVVRPPEHGVYKLPDGSIVAKPGTLRA